MKMIQSFDPSAEASGSFKHQVANPCGGVYLFNESNVWLGLTLPDGGRIGLPAWWARFYKLEAVQGDVEWMSLATISSVASPLSQVYGESYERSEISGRTFYDGPIPRNPFIGNQVQSSVSTNQVINDGNPLMSVLEATLQGNTGGSNALINTDGSFYFAQWVSSVYEKYLQGIPGANPIIELGAKVLLQALDQSGADATSILFVDSSGNTIIGSHKTNNQTIIVDKNGNPLLTVDANGMAKIAGVGQSNNGDHGGTQTVYEGMYGIYKLVIVYQNAYNQQGGAFQPTLKTSFASGAAWFNMGCGGLEATNGGSALVSNQITWGTGTSAGTSAGGTGMPSFSCGVVNSPITKIGDSGGYVGAHTGFGIFIGV